MYAQCVSGAVNAFSFVNCSCIHSLLCEEWETAYI